LEREWKNFYFIRLIAFLFLMFLIFIPVTKLSPLFEQTSNISLKKCLLFFWASLARWDIKDYSFSTRFYLGIFFKSNYYIGYSEDGTLYVGCFFKRESSPYKGYDGGWFRNRTDIVLTSLSSISIIPTLLFCNKRQHLNK
jgi:hypothetical protein